MEAEGGAWPRTEGRRGESKEASVGSSVRRATLLWTSLALLGCTDPDPAQTTPVPVVPAVPSEAAAEPESPPETEPAEPVALAPWQYVFFDGCWDARAETVEAAHAGCVERRERGNAWERRFCRCAPDHLLTVRSTDPIAYFLDTECWHRGATPDAVRAACERGEHLGCSCDSLSIVAVRGPYERRRELGGYDDPERYRFLSDEGHWLDEVGEPPCFVAGTPVLTPEGERAIESLSAGDVVVSYDPSSRRLVSATVHVVRTRHAPSIGRVQTSDGRALRVTPNHPFFIADEETWRVAGNLEVGDVLLALDGSRRLRMVSIEVVELDMGESVEVWNLSVEAPHTYFANGLLVHNY